jgi:5-methylcytosine-specific restriction endonuclease McrA
MCFSKPREPLKNKKAMHRFGPVAAKWMEVRNQWMQDNPPPWYCFYCGELLTIDTLTVEHKKSRSRHPEFRFTLDNLAPACYACNSDKGSLDDTEYIEKMRGRRIS